MKKCFDLCSSKDVACPIKDCRYWIEYPDDLNCTMVAVDKNGRMTLREVADRMGVSFVRIKQIETKEQEKLNKRLLRKERLH